METDSKTNQSPKTTKNDYNMMSRNLIFKRSLGVTHKLLKPTSITPSIAYKAAPSPDNYLKNLNKSDLFSLFLIGCCSINKPILNTVIKIFPYVPLPLIKRFIYNLYCGGETFQEVLNTGNKLKKNGINNMMLSLTIEDSEGTKNIDIDYIVNETISSVKNILKPHLLNQLNEKNINDIPPGYIALKPSALVKDPYNVLLNYSLDSKDPHHKKQSLELFNNCSKITEVVKDLNEELSKIYPTRASPFFISTIDAEKFDLQESGVYALQRDLFKKFNLNKYKHISVIGTWQLYLKGSKDLLLKELEMAEKDGTYSLGCKLVRGAYIHSEKHRNEIIFDTKENTDINYDDTIDYVSNHLLNNKDSKFGHLVVASHNYNSQLLVTKKLNANRSNVNNSKIVLAQLYGMADNITYDLINHHNCKNIIKYVPWSNDSYETKDYLLRRLQENGDAIRTDNGLPLLKAIFRSLV